MVMTGRCQVTPPFGKTWSPGTCKVAHLFGFTFADLLVGWMAFAHLCIERLVGLVVKACASEAGDPGFESRLRRDFSGVESYQ